MKTKFNNIFSKIGLAVMAIALAICGLFSVQNLTHESGTADATFTDTEIVSGIDYPDNAYFMTFAGNRIVAVDKDGYVYKAEEATVNLVRTGSRLSVQSQFPITMDPSTSPCYSYYGEAELIGYKNGTIVFAGSDGNNVKMYYSTDNAGTWSYNIVKNGYIPASLLVGNGYFACMIYNPNNSFDAYIIKSADGVSWTETRVKNLDAKWTFGSGYFVRTEYPKATDSSKTPQIMRSVDLITWESTAAPIDAHFYDYGNGQHSSYLLYPMLIPFCYNNEIYCRSQETNQSGVPYLYKTTNFQTWKLTGIARNYYKAETYQNGIIFASEYKIAYCEFVVENETDVMVNSKSLFNTFYATNDYDAHILYPSTIIHSDKYLLIGDSGKYGYENSVDEQYYNDFVNSKFKLYQQPDIIHTVLFKDWNGNIYATIQVPDGELVNAPVSNPTRTGYTFAGWSGDLTAPITNDTIFTATYTANTYNVSFLDYNGQIISTLQVQYDNALNPADIPIPEERVGYQFVGWDKDTTQRITSDTTFHAQYTEKATLTVIYPGVIGKSGLINQFNRTGAVTKSFEYNVGDRIRSEEYISWFDSTIQPWIDDFDDGYYDYDVKYTGYSEGLPETITRNMTVYMTYEKLLLVSLNYYSQLRFYIQDNVYYTFIGYMTIERYVQSGYLIDLEYFKRPDVNYDIYNANQSAFYNNLHKFTFNGWDHDLTEPITENTAIRATYTLPQVHLRMFDADGYLFNERNQDVSFLTVEDLQQMAQDNAVGNVFDWFREFFRNLFLFRIGDAADMIADSFDISAYLNRVQSYHNMSTQILLGFIQLDTDNPDMYSGIFRNGSADVVGSGLKYYSGTPDSNNLTYFIGMETFSTDLITLNVTVTYGTALDSIIKTVQKWWGYIAGFFTSFWTFLTKWWWAIALVVLLIIFRKPIVAGIKSISSSIKKKANEKKKNSKYKKAEKQLDYEKKKSKKSTAYKKKNYYYKKGKYNG